MVDFGKKIKVDRIVKKINPIEIYDQLDRKVDKGPLRPAQISILNQWFDIHKAKKDNIIKLHTGQGKTLIGLLILQSSLNENKGPAVFLCANNFLVKQTCEQARQFGVKYCESDANGDLPVEFIEGQAIFICSVQKMFNGLSKFGLGPSHVKTGTIIIDDAHSCIDSIQSACMIKIESNQGPFSELRNLFESDLRHQGEGTYLEISQGVYDAFSVVPYWAWQERLQEVTNILGRHTDKKAVKFAWPILKDRLKDCICVFSGHHLEITPRLIPIDMFGSYSSAEHRVYMSATVADDSLMIKDLRIPKNAIEYPIVFPDEKWSGEKMILLPSLIDEQLSRENIVNWLAKPNQARTFGIVALTPSSSRTADWKGYGASIAERDTIDEMVESLKNRVFQNVVVIANRYDGIDLPDEACRILVLDSKPFSESLLERYQENVRGSSDMIHSRIARSIEQGLGRSVRGEKDYCAIIIIGVDLTTFLRLSSNQKFFSSQTKKQIAIGLEIAELAKSEISEGTDPNRSLKKLVAQSLNRDENWKAYYSGQMNSIDLLHTPSPLLTIYEMELSAELKFLEGDIQKATEILQELIDKFFKDNKEESAWYLQEMARYKYLQSKSDSENLQKAAHKKNHYLLKPRTGMVIEQIEKIGLRRTDQIIAWLKKYNDYSDIQLRLSALFSDLSLGVNHDLFEEALKQIGFALGFNSQRPDKEWKEGPDNLWCVNDNTYILFECKNEVEEMRVEVNKYEVAQMNSSCGWFAKNYPGCSVSNILIIPTFTIGRGSSFTHEVKICNKKGLEHFKNQVRSFFDEFNGKDFNDLTADWVQQRLLQHSLDNDHLLQSELKKPKPAV